MKKSLAKVSVSLKPETRERLSSLGRMDQNYDQLIREIMDHAEQCDHFWESRY